jgi:hypothetical protein
MIDFWDALGPVSIPDNLVEQVKSYVPPAESFDKGTPWQVKSDGPNVWTLIEAFKASSGGHVHRVERRYNDLRCTCQSFRIQKTGKCKHTEIVKQKLGL